MKRQEAQTTMPRKQLQSSFSWRSASVLDTVFDSVWREQKAGAQERYVFQDSGPCQKKLSQGNGVLEECLSTLRFQQKLADVRTQGFQAASPLMARPFAHLLPKGNIVRRKLQARKLDRHDSDDVITCVQGSQD